MRTRKILTTVLDVLCLVAFVVLIWRAVTGDFKLEIGPMKLGAKRFTRIVYALAALLALRTLIEVRGHLAFRPAAWLGRIAFGKGAEGEAWPFAARWWLVLPWLCAAAGAVFGMTHAGWILLDRAGAFEVPALGVFFLLSWMMPGLFLGLSLGAAWTLLLALGRHLGVLPSASAKDVKITFCGIIAAAAYAGHALIGDWDYASRLSPTADVVAPYVLAVLGLVLFAVIYPALARRSRTEILIAVGVPLVSMLIYGIAAPKRTDRIPEGRAPRHVVLITFDTIRADHLSCYGYERNTSPEIDRLAAEGVRFEKAMVSRACTDASHTTILTGLYAREHGVVTNGIPISNPDTPSLAEWFRARGFATAAITNRSHLNPDDLLLPGYDYVSAPTSKKLEGTGTEVLDRATAWVHLHRKEDFFLWVHWWDPHNQYDPPEPHRSMFNDGKERPKWTKCGTQLPDATFTKDQRDHRTSLYDGEIHYADATIGKFMKFLEEASPDEPPLMILVGDHGEIMDEYYEAHNYAFDHSLYVNDALLHVPLIVRWPGMIEPRVVPDVVETVNLAATIADLAFPGSSETADGEFLGKYGQVKVPRAVQLDRAPYFQTQRSTPWYAADSKYRSRGISMVPLMRGEPWTVPSLAFSWRRAKSAPLQKWLGYPAFSVRDPRWRYEDGGRHGEALYDREAETFEFVNVLEKHPEVAERLKQALAEWKLRIPEIPPDWGSSSEDTEEDMRRLGYVR